MEGEFGWTFWKNLPPLDGTGCDCPGDDEIRRELVYYLDQNSDRSGLPDKEFDHSLRICRRSHRFEEMVITKRISYSQACDKWEVISASSPGGPMFFVIAITFGVVPWNTRKYEGRQFFTAMGILEDVLELTGVAPLT